MNRIGKLIAMFICAAMVIATAPELSVDAASIVARGPCGASGVDLIWELDSNGVLTISGTGPMKNYCSTRSLLYQCGKEKNVKKIVIEPGVTSIDSYAFYGLDNVTEVTIPDGVTSIGTYAFCRLKNINKIDIPDSVTYIGSYTFYFCSGIKEVSLRGIVDIGLNAFAECSNLAAIEIGDSATHIGGSAFENTAFYKNDENWSEDWQLYIGHHLIRKSPYFYAPGETVIRDGTLTIADYAFKSCNTEGVVIPDSVTHIGSGAFSGGQFLHTLPDIPNSVTHIGSRAFEDCSNLITAYVPDSVTYLGANAFSACLQLKSVRLPADLTEIQSGTFSSCYELAEITFPDNLTAIGDKAFMNCRSLKDLSVPDGVTYIGEYCFQDCSSLAEMQLPDSVTSIGKRAFSGCEALKSVSIPDGITEIPDYTFCYCRALTDIALPDSVERIGDWAFQYCDSLTEFDFPENLNVIGLHAFEYCTGLKSLTIPAGVKNICGNAFYYCIGLTDVTLPEGLLSLDSDAFRYCTNLISINIPDSIEKIGYNVFEKTALYNDPDNWENGVFYVGRHVCGSDSSYYFGTLTLRPGTLTISQDAFNGCIYMTGAILPEGIRIIDTWAFSGCGYLYYVSIPASVERIGERNFVYNSMASADLDDVYYGGSKEDWEKITIESNNQGLLRANIHFDSYMAEPPRMEIKNVSVKKTFKQLTVKVERENVPYYAVLMAVSYDSDGAILSIARMDRDDSATIPATNVATVKVFCWESMKTLKPLCEPASTEL